MNTTHDRVRALILTAAWAAVSSAHAAAPPNDLFRNRIALEGIAPATTGSNVSATRESGEPRHNAVLTGQSVWWSWKASEAGFLSVSTEGSTFDTVVAVYTGSSLSALAEVASDDDGGVNFTSKTTFRVEAGITYQIAVDGYSEDGIVESGSIRLNLAFASQLLAPVWNLKDVDGKAVDSTNYAGKVVLVNFWATWCGPCVSEMPGLIRLQDRYRQQGFAIVGISVDEGGPNVVRPFIPQHKLNYQVLMSNGRVENDFGGIQYIPTTFLVDREGYLLDKFVGYTSEADFETKIKPLLVRADPPRAAIQARAGRLVVAWPLEQTATAIETSDSVTGPWTATAVSGVATNGQFEAEFPASAKQGFYRLRR